jgi:hypothetical protein
MHRRSFLAASAGSAALIALPAASTHSDWTVVEFPRDFLWGVSTSAFQIEGGLKADGRGPSIWDQVAAEDSGLIAEPAVDHYRHWRRDITLLKQLGVNAYRFSVAWPRVLPEGDGPINDLGLDFYDRLIDGLRGAVNFAVGGLLIDLSCWSILRWSSGARRRESYRKLNSPMQKIAAGLLAIFVLAGTMATAWAGQLNVPAK